MGRVPTGRRRGNPNLIKGTTTNRGGRKKIPHEVTALAQAQTEKAINALSRVLDLPVHPGSKDLPAIVNAAKALLDRAWGSPFQQVPPQQKRGEMQTVTITFGAQPPSVDVEDPDQP